MYTLLRSVGTRDVLLVEAPAATAAIVVAEVFYKFHSFVVECGAFLATWFVLGSVVALVVRRPAVAASTFSN